MENAKEIDKFIDSYKRPMLNNKYINLNRPKINKEFETVIKGPPTKKIRPIWIHYRILTDCQWSPIIKTSQITQQIKRNETLSNSFYKVSITLITKLGENFKMT